MKKKGLVLIFSMVAAVMMLMVSPTWAYDSADHVSVAPNMQGDLLVYPLYIAGSGLETSFTVVNSDPNNSVVAKVVLRSHKYSQEVLDFLIYLSPNDVFKAKIYYEGGKYMLTSTDDSLVVGDGIQASADAPQVFELAAPCLGEVSDDSAGWGYIEVIEAVSFNLTKKADLTVPKLTEDTITGIWNAYDAWNGASSPAPNTINTLSGFAEVDLVGADYAAYQATAFQDYFNQSKIIVGPLTILGTLANNSLCEVEGALAKNNLVIPYYDAADAASLPVLTFPTKLSLCPAEWADEDVPEARGPFFTQNGWDVTYKLTYFDMEEHRLTKTCTHSPCPTTPELDLSEEVNLVGLDSPFAAGWARAFFGTEEGAYSTTCTAADTTYDVTFAGAPVIPMIVHFTQDGLSFVPVAHEIEAPVYAP